MRLCRLLTFTSLLALTLSLKIATSLQWIEHTPQPYAIQNFYKGATSATLSSGGVANLASDTSFDLAANAETQGLKQYANHKDIRLIYIVVEVAYRLVARKSSDIRSLADLKGKRIGTIAGTSAQIFVARMLDSVGVKETQYTIVSGNVCMKAPCAADTFPAQLASKQIDAFGIWEPAVELGIQTVGADNVVVFQNASVYREVYSLYSMTEKLADKGKRRDIVAFVRALNQTLEIFANRSESVYSFVAKQVGVDVDVVRDVWADHRWRGPLGSDLMQLLVEEDAYLAKIDKRAATSSRDLEKFLDDSVIREL